MNSIINIAKLASCLRGVTKLFIALVLAFAGIAGAAADMPTEESVKRMILDSRTREGGAFHRMILMTANLQVRPTAWLSDLPADESRVILEKVFRETLAGVIPLYQQYYTQSDVDGSLACGDPTMQKWRGGGGELAAQELERTFNESGWKLDLINALARKIATKIAALADVTVADERGEESAVPDLMAAKLWVATGAQSYMADLTEKEIRKAQNNFPDGHPKLLSIIEEVFNEIAGNFPEVWLAVHRKHFTDAELDTIVACLDGMPAADKFAKVNDEWLRLNHEEIWRSGESQ